MMEEEEYELDPDRLREDRDEFDDLEEEEEDYDQ